ncbi:MAG: hypothetical protein ACKOA9_08940, partial [Actinomycetota bacterium]
EEWRTARAPGKIHLEYLGRGDEPPAGSDLALVLAGYTSVTVLQGIGADDAGALADAIASTTLDYGARS